jgi:hypothetical protein
LAGSLLQINGTAVAATNAIVASLKANNIDDVRVYNRALSATEVKELYNLGTAKITTH